MAASRAHLTESGDRQAAAVAVGESDKAISMVDADGVSLAAIQALNARVVQLERELARLKRSS